MTTFADIVLRFLHEERFPIYVFLARAHYVKEPNELSYKARIEGFALNLLGQKPFFRFTTKLRKRGANGVLLWFDDGTIMFIVPSCKEEESVYDVMRRVIRRLYPLIITPLISVDSYFEIIDGLAEKYGVIVEEYFLRRRKGQKSMKEWTREPYEKAKLEILRDMKEKRSTLEAIKIKLTNSIGKSALLKIARQGILVIYDMLPDILVSIQEDILYKHFEKFLMEINTFNKVRKKLTKINGYEDYTITAMRLYFGENQVMPNDFPKLLDALRESFYVSVYYRGNPWMHLGLIDKGDGSSYEIIVSSNEARIIPDVKAAGSSLNLIVDAFRTIVPEPKLELE